MLVPTIGIGRSSAAGRLVDRKGGERVAIVDWIAVCPDDRQSGYATRALEKLERVLIEQDASFGLSMVELRIAPPPTGRCVWWGQALTRRGFKLSSGRSLPKSTQCAPVFVKRIGDDG